MNEGELNNGKKSESKKDGSEEAKKKSYKKSAVVKCNTDPVINLGRDELKRLATLFRVRASGIVSGCLSSWRQRERLKLSDARTAFV
jgi:hypothetical protein